MTQSVTFEGQIEALQWGDKVFTVLRLPAWVMDALGQPKRVAGDLNYYPINLAPARAPETVIADPFLWTGKELLKAANIAPGDVFDVSLQAADPNFVDVPSDVLAAVRMADAHVSWDGLTPGRKRGLLHPITTSKRPQTRAARIEKLIESLRA